MKKKARPKTPARGITVSHNNFTGLHIDGKAIDAMIAIARAAEQQAITLGVLAGAIRGGAEAVRFNSLLAVGKAEP